MKKSIMYMRPANSQQVMKVNCSYCDYSARTFCPKSDLDHFHLTLSVISRT